MADQENPLEIKLEGDNIPEKFKGKTVVDVLKSYGEAEKTMHQTKSESDKKLNEATQNIETLKQQLVAMQQQPEEKRDPDEYASMGDVAKTVEQVFQKLEEKEKSIAEKMEAKLEDMKKETSLNAEYQIAETTFLAKNPGLSKENARAIAKFGLEQGKDNFDDAYESFKEFASKVGLKPEQEQVNVPTNILGGIPGYKEGAHEYDKDWIERTKSRGGKIGSHLSK